ncbi:helix-turn-helix transcriptional regulator [Arthrobacter sp. H35-D1]|uniref:helix-turn-helix domain-containing protein n=1 Tax=Arthrobacter sp. H35-D1 TaxID=3046202 RepID=UPI0024B9C8B7|nr:helix-turn-helix transcriptional regulator [Arthrobacter sp. H35-D1]MDJ0315073.1 helix-turn-helix transcriptional regulator [Arthrobacter sp. H35-D1]
MANKTIEEGPSARTARENLKRIREEKDITWTVLSNMLAKEGRKIPPISIRRAEEGERRLDVDDLMALAFVLDVSPNELLLPAKDFSGVVEVTGPGERSNAEVWAWAMDGADIGSPTAGFAKGTEFYVDDNDVRNSLQQVAAVTESEAFRQAVRDAVREALADEK